MFESSKIKKSYVQSRSCRTSLGSLGEVDGSRTSSGEEEVEEEEKEDDVYVALDKDYPSGMFNFLWAVRKFSEAKKITIVHVHNPADKFNIMGGWFAAQKVNEEQVEVHRADEKNKVYELLEQYVKLCKTRMVEIVVNENADVGKGLVELVAELGITKLVMGAAADKHFKSRMNSLKSRKARHVQEHAHPSCKIWFVCKGELICIRHAAPSFTHQEDRQFGEPTYLEEDGLYGEIYDKLRILEAKYGESSSSQGAKTGFNEIIQKVKVAERLYTNTLKQKKKFEETVKRQKRQGLKLYVSTSTADEFSEFSLAELQQATDDFHKSRKIGEGGYGDVYKGEILRQTAVAVKRLNPKSAQGPLEFNQELNVLRKVRHPNLVTLIGACTEARALVYEYLPNGSLEDWLACESNTPPLTWQERTRIAAEICSTMLFIHSCKPHAIVHGDLKPANILLDENLAIKLSDFGISRLLAQPINGSTVYHLTRQPKGTLPYMAPELLSYGQITTRSDVFSFGVILLRLLTGMSALLDNPTRWSNLIELVDWKLETGRLEDVLDARAGDWPHAHAEQLALLALRCCELNRKIRVDAEEAWKILEPMAKTAASSSTGPSTSSSFRSSYDDYSRASSSTSSDLPGTSTYSS